MCHFVYKQIFVNVVTLSQFFRISLVYQLISYRTNSLRKNCERIIYLFFLAPKVLNSLGLKFIYLFIYLFL